MVGPGQGESGVVPSQAGVSAGALLHNRKFFRRRLRALDPGCAPALVVVALRGSVGKNNRLGLGPIMAARQSETPRAGFGESGHAWRAPFATRVSSLAKLHRSAGTHSSVC